MSYTFTFDASACSGCKACQEACKDKNDLPAGVIWRKVIEVSGGTWQASGAAWENNVFAYNISLACNHCVHPKCAGVCPTDAYITRPDGIVFIDTNKCMGCGYCAWACPYAAPQYDPTRGIMTKCDFCQDNIDAGSPPSCVAACPLRALDFQVVEDTVSPEGIQDLWRLPGEAHPFPLPVYSRTEPHLALKPHPAMDTMQERTIANREEILPVAAGHGTDPLAVHELPLVAFTLLAQMAAGLAVLSLAFKTAPLSILLTIGALLGVSGMISFLHLGRKRNAWRVLAHLSKSWLSREVLMALLFAASWAAAIGTHLLHLASPVKWLMALSAIGLVHSMARVYRLHAVPAWDTPRTNLAFFLSAALLASLGMHIIIPHPAWLLIAAVALAAELLMTRPTRQLPFPGAGTLRLSMLVLAILSIPWSIFLPQPPGSWLSIIPWLASLTASFIGRWQFYASRIPWSD